MIKVCFLSLLMAMFATQVTAQTRPGPTSCELANGFLNLAMSEGSRDVVLIVIARLGKTEYRQELNKRRLYNVEMYLTKFNKDSFFAKNPKNVIYAEGEKTEGLGVLELFS